MAPCNHTVGGEFAIPGGIETTDSSIAGLSLAVLHQPGEPVGSRDQASRGTVTHHVSWIVALVAGAVSLRRTEAHKVSYRAALMAFRLAGQATGVARYVPVVAAVGAPFVLRLDVGDRQGLEHFNFEEERSVRIVVERSFAETRQLTSQLLRGELASFDEANWRSNSFLISHVFNRFVRGLNERATANSVRRRLALYRLGPLHLFSSDLQAEVDSIS